MARILFLLLGIVVAVSAATDLDTLAAKYRHAILQSDQPITISSRMRLGKSSTITIAINDQSVEATIGAGGRRGHIQCTLPAMPAGGPFEMVFTANTGETARATDVYISDVWLCIGQSNMCFPMTKMHSADTWKPAEKDNFPDIRFRSRKGWTRATSIDVIKNLAGTPYYFARALHRELKRPIGIVVAGQGGTSLWQWTPDELHQTPELAPLRAIMAKRVAMNREQKKAGKRKITYPPVAGFSPYRYPHFPFEFGQLAGFENWVPTFSGTGIVFWQGENDIGLGAPYEHLFGGMLASWRERATREWPFIFIQLPTYTDGPGKPSKHVGIEAIRDAQRRVAAADPLSHMMVSYDIYGRGIHPSSKRAYGERLAQTALGMVYEHDIPWRSPEFTSAANNGAHMTLTFAHAGKGLRARDGGTTIAGFTLAGEDGTFHPAKATVTAPDTICVMSPEVSKPVAVRYAWATNPVADLVGDGDLPVSPFRSDDWQLYPLTQ